jgi:hypothetical protein
LRRVPAARITKAWVLHEDTNRAKQRENFYSGQWPAPEPRL